MKKGLLAVAVSSLLLLAAAPAIAVGPYVGLEGGVVWLSDADIPETVLTWPAKASFDTGWSIGAVGGYDFGTWRLEGELAYRSNDADQGTITGGPDTGSSGPINGDMTSTALMVNAYYDFKTLSPSVYPYIGAGIGGASVSADISDPVDGKFIDDDDIVFAYQLVAGVAFPVSKQLTIDLNYRYFATSDPSFELYGTGLSVDTEYSSHNVFAGLRYNF